MSKQTEAQRLADLIDTDYHGIHSRAAALIRRQDELLKQALEPRADVKPRDWKTDREKLWRLRDAIRAHLEVMK